MDDHQFSYITNLKKLPCSGYQDLPTYWKRGKNKEGVSCPLLISGVSKSHLPPTSA
jgi:hypothetical protein